MQIGNIPLLPKNCYCLLLCNCSFVVHTFHIKSLYGASTDSRFFFSLYSFLDVYNSNTWSHSCGKGYSAKQTKIIKRCIDV